MGGGCHKDARPLRQRVAGLSDGLDTGDDDHHDHILGVAVLLRNTHYVVCQIDPASRPNTFAGNGSGRRMHRCRSVLHEKLVEDLIALKRNDHPSVVTMQDQTSRLLTSKPFMESRRSDEACPTALFRFVGSSFLHEGHQDGDRAGHDSHDDHQSQKVFQARSHTSED